ncbi:hypothetical protein TVAG_219160 [Trichomonas vaginalis G3]|uniref:Uncharacterized protein n=1 Tax=Trichomonas vaginalis (strain ATCC PRA-98 / G3) TaxID=412133 RepID=A2FKP8_TRIV3|nr:hypothetical protein TVAGG3_0866870 [Trichomonas vaginalis G3]EAX94510.1 hypothetical protein TVAG_219160 [Trichomonas vaginalis G3]KAI5501092.1 hypothetical protein TVAGG3_0866870 [Trichomonas vaginalis G3]|eukprot:XP_001307440.1 hypothetical protein [Trichomonas vaginalis G3]
MSNDEPIILDHNFCTKARCKISTNAVLLDLTNMKPSSYYKFQIWGVKNGNDINLNPNKGWYIVKMGDMSLYQTTAAANNCDRIYLKFNREILGGGLWNTDADRKIRPISIDSKTIAIKLESVYDKDELQYLIQNFQNTIMNMLQHHHLNTYFDKLWKHDDDMTDLEYIISESIFKFEEILCNFNNPRLIDTYKHILQTRFSLSKYEPLPCNNVRVVFEVADVKDAANNKFIMNEIKKIYLEETPVYNKILEEQKEMVKTLAKNDFIRRSEKNYYAKILSNIYTADKVNRMLSVKSCIRPVFQKQNSV